MNLALAVLVVAGFAAAIELLGLSERGGEIAQRGRESARVLRDPSLDDEAKEKLMQEHSLVLFRLLGVMLLGMILALGLPLAMVWFISAMGIGSFEQVWLILQRVDFLLAAMVVGSLAFLVVRAGRRSR